jgi:hypothetical protein
MSQPNTIEIVRRVLAWHQNAYARFHNAEGHKVIEADSMAIGYTAVELEKWLTSFSPNGVWPPGESEWSTGLSLEKENGNSR